jgi:hypothetical protein
MPTVFVRERAREDLIALVLVEMTGKKRDRALVYAAYLDRLRVGTDLGPTRGQAW